MKSEILAAAEPYSESLVYLLDDPEWRRYSDQVSPALVRYAKRVNIRSAEKATRGVLDDFRITEMQLLTIKYGNNEPWLNPVANGSTTWNNKQNVENTVRWSISERTTDAFKWSFKEGFKLGATTTFQTGVPWILEGKIEVSAELSFEAGQEKTVTVDRQWQQEVTVKIPPKSTTVGKWVVMAGKYDTPYEALVRLRGRINYVLLGPDGNAVSYWQQVETSDPNLQTVLSPGEESELLLRFSGRWTGVAGQSLVVDTEDRPIEEIVQSYAANPVPFSGTARMLAVSGARVVGG